MALTLSDSLYAVLEKSPLEKLEGLGFYPNLGKYRNILLVDSVLYVSCPDPLVDAFNCKNNYLTLTYTSYIYDFDLIVRGGWT